MRKSEQLFKITRAPEVEPLNKNRLARFLRHDRPDSEWDVREILPQPEQGQGEKSCKNCRDLLHNLLRECHPPEGQEACEHWQPVFSSKVDDETLLDLYRKFYAVWNRCESNRGCYSCSELHDCRCPLSRDPEGKTWRRDLTPWRCECGRDELEKIETEIDELDTCRETGKGRDEK